MRRSRSILIAGLIVFASLGSILIGVVISIYPSAVCVRRMAHETGDPLQDIIGTWEYTSDPEEDRLLTFRADGTFHYVNYSAHVMQEGRWRMVANALEMQPGDERYEWGTRSRQWMIRDNGLFFWNESTAAYQRSVCAQW